MQEAPKKQSQERLKKPLNLLNPILSMFIQRPPHISKVDAFCETWRLEVLQSRQIYGPKTHHLLRARQSWNEKGMTVTTLRWWLTWFAQP